MKSNLKTISLLLIVLSSVAASIGCSVYASSKSAAETTKPKVSVVKPTPEKIDKYPKSSNRDTMPDSTASTGDKTGVAEHDDTSKNTKPVSPAKSLKHPERR